MTILKLKRLGFLLVALVLAAGCTPVNASLATATGAPSSSVLAPAATATSTAANTTNNPSTTGPAAAGTANGGSLTFSLTPGKSTASYKVREQLAGKPLPNDAIGKTTTVSGSVMIKADGSIDASSSKFVVDLTTLVSDQSMRDGYVQRNILQTGQYPTATFVPTQAAGLPNPLPTSGQVNFQLTGDMTIHGVTKSITWTVTGEITSGSAAGTAVASFKFEDFGLSQPRVSVVLSVVDLITLQIDGAI